MNADKLVEAYRLAREASFQSHPGHWDRTGQSGTGCPECIRASRLRDEAHKLFKEATEQGIIEI
jgi:hypothetical protein